MASTSGKDLEIGGEDDNQQRSTMGTSSECAGRGHEKEARVSDDDHTPQDWWSNYYQFLIGLCYSSAASSTPKCRAPPSSSPPPSWYHSARIQDMMEKRGEFSTQVESEIEASRVTWSEVDGTVSQAAEHSGMTNREYLEVLKRRKYVRKGDEIVFEQIPEENEVLFDECWCKDLVVGEKLAEGGQAEIYAATSPGDFPMAVKVFKGGTGLQHLEKQFPPGLLNYTYLYNYSLPGYDHDSDRRQLPMFMEATVLSDERLGWKDRFAFVMSRFWEDLRKLIDHQMMHSSHNRGPPFPDPVQFFGLMVQIASQMSDLHHQCPPILHNDLKAANVLVESNREENGPLITMYGGYLVSVTDYECSVGVEGTGFWRAPEIFQQLEHRVAGSPLVFTDKCDVYSYGMVCYELATGRIPFEGCSPYEGRALVLEGRRPDLPPDIDPVVEDIIVACWQAVPSERPSFDDIINKFYNEYELECVLGSYDFCKGLSRPTGLVQ